MASETIYGYFGKKGAGKTHELIRVILQRLREGRYVVAVIPQLDVEKVASYLGDPSVKERLIVKDYTDVEDDENFFPDEHLIRRLQMWKRGDPVPEDAHKWRSSVVIPGSFLVIDEAWRWLENKKTIPPRLKAALHMARHWQGPMVWNDPEQVAKYKDPNWFPMMGGAEFDTLPKDQAPAIFPEEWQQLEDGSWRRPRGGDGTPLCTANILFASQDFFGLERSLRAQIDQVTQLISIRDSYFPTLLKKATDGKEQYMAYTFEAADMPTRRQMLSSLEKGERLWLAEECVTHDNAIHELKAYTAGYAKENRVDNKADLKNNPHWKKIKRQGYLMLGLLVIAGAASAMGIKKLGSSNDLVAQQAHTTFAAAGSPGALPVAGASQQPSPEQLGYSGKVGSTIVLEQGGQTQLYAKSSATRLVDGSYIIDVDGRSINSAYDLAGSNRFVRGGGGNVVPVRPQQGGSVTSSGAVSADSTRQLSAQVRADAAGGRQGS